MESAAACASRLLPTSTDWIYLRVRVISGSVRVNRLTVPIYCFFQKEERKNICIYLHTYI